MHYRDQRCIVSRQELYKRPKIVIPAHLRRAIGNLNMQLLRFPDASGNDRFDLFVGELTNVGDMILYNLIIVLL